MTGKERIPQFPLARRNDGRLMDCDVGNSERRREEEKGR
jgi:hypothetical protein